MKKQCKEYRYKKNAVFSLLVAAFLFFILAFIMGFLEDDLAFRIPGICSLLVGILFIFMFVHAMRTSPLITTEDEIIFSERPFAKTLHIPVKDIVKVKIQMDRSFRAGVLVWYHYGDEIRKARIGMKNLRQEDQEGFRDYLENLP